MPMTASPPRFEYFDLPGDCRLAVNSNQKLKTVSVLVAFVGNLDATATQKTMLPAILRRGTRHYPSMQSVNRYLEGLYGTGISGSVEKVGEWHVVRFRLDVVNDRFVPGDERIVRQALEFLRGFLLDPLQVADGFHAEFLEQEKSNLKRTIEGLVDNKGAYAEHRMIAEMCASEPFRLLEHGRVEDIPQITPSALWTFYREWAQTHPLYVYVTGNVDVGDARELTEEVLLKDFQARRGGYALAPLPPRVAVGDVREVRDRMDVQQAKLVMGFRHGITHADDLYEALLLMNGVLGGFSHSKLFQNVREKASLAYTCHSRLERTKGLLTISSGIAVENYEKAVAIILEQVRAMQAGDISDEELEATLLTILNNNEMLEDNPQVLCDVDFVWALHGRPLDLTALRERLVKVRKEDLVAAAKRLEHDTTYLLSP